MFATIGDAIMHTRPGDGGGGGRRDASLSETRRAKEERAKLRRPRVYEGRMQS